LNSRKSNISLTIFKYTESNIYFSHRHSSTLNFMYSECPC